MLINTDDCLQQLAAGLERLGIVPGDTVLLHASFKSLGPVPGGMETVIQGFLRALGTEGTLLLPALSWALRPPEVFDVRATPTNTGAVPEYFRTRPGTARSLHPTHSVCAVGWRMHELLDGHRLDCTPCGPHSPFRALAETGGKVVMLGCGLKPNTTMHALEEYVEPPYLFGKSYRFTLIDQEGRACQKEYRTHGFCGYAQRYDRVQLLDDAGSFLRSGQVLAATVHVLDAPRLREAVVKKLRSDSWFFVEPAPGRDRREERV